MTNSFIHEDLARNWHPLTPLDRQYAGEVLALQGAQGDYLICADNRRVIDGISSWWCKLLGHQHPVLRQALIDQAHSLAS